MPHRCIAGLLVPEDAKDCECNRAEYWQSQTNFVIARMSSLPHDGEPPENWDDAVQWAEIADAFYHCSAKNETIKQLGKKYIIVVRQ